MTLYGGRGDLFPFFGGNRFGSSQGFEEDFVFLFGHGTVDVVCGALVPAGGVVDLVHVDGAGVRNGRDGVVEGEVLRAGEALEFGGERGRGQGAGCEDGDGVGLYVEGEDLFAVNGDVGTGCYTLSYAAGEVDAVDGEGVT